MQVSEETCLGFHPGLVIDIHRVDMIPKKMPHLNVPSFAQPLTSCYICMYHKQFSHELCCHDGFKQSLAGLLLLSSPFRKHIKVKEAALTSDRGEKEQLCNGAPVGCFRAVQGIRMLELSFRAAL